MSKPTIRDRVLAVLPGREDYPINLGDAASAAGITYKQARRFCLNSSDVHIYIDVWRDDVPHNPPKDTP